MGRVGFNRYLAIVVVIIQFLPKSVAAEVSPESTTRITHTAIQYFVSDRRIRIRCKVHDDNGVKLVRCYFKSGFGAHYLFVDMTVGGNGGYEAVLPAPSATTEKIQYLLLAVNGLNRVVRSQDFQMNHGGGRKAGAWQSDLIQGDAAIRVGTELPQAPEPMSGFNDRVSVDVAESEARFGSLIGLYGSMAQASVAEVLTNVADISVVAATSATSTTAVISTVAAAVAIGGAIAVSDAGGNRGGSASSSVSAPSSSSDESQTTTNPDGSSGDNGSSQSSESVASSPSETTEDPAPPTLGTAHGVWVSNVIYGGSSYGSEAHNVVCDGNTVESIAPATVFDSNNFVSVETPFSVGGTCDAAQACQNESYPLYDPVACGNSFLEFQHALIPDGSLTFQKQ